jgi:apolipoprotein N-acyltransferase
VQGKDRPGLIVNVTNDGWFGNTTGPRQHLHQARVRAVEEGVPLIRSANNGISALIDANGRVLQRLDLDVRGTIDAPLPQMLSPPPYSRWGDALFWIAFAGVLVFCTASQSMVRVRHS